MDLVTRLLRLIVRFLFTHPDWTAYGVLTAIMAALFCKHYGVF